MPNEAHASRKKNSMTLMLLSLTVILLICLIGYDILKENWSPSIYAEKKIKSRRPMRLVSDSGDPQKSTSSLTKKLSKSHVSRLNDYPEKQSIPDLEKSIIANEFLHNKAHSTIRNLEKELELANKKIESFDYALDTLTSKIEMTRAEKERLEGQYQAQISQVQEQNNREKEEFKNSLQESVSNQYLLKKNIEEKIGRINELTEQLSTQKTSFEEQSKEVEALVQKMQSANASLDYEKAQSIYLKGELAKAHEKTNEAHTHLAAFEAEFDVAVNQERLLKDSIGQLNTALAMKDLEINTLIDSFSDAKKEMHTELQDMVFFVNLEKNHSQNLHHQLQVALEKFDQEKMAVVQLQEKLNAAFDQISSLEETLTTDKNYAAARELGLLNQIDELERVKRETAENITRLGEFFEVEHLALESTLRKLEIEASRTQFLHEKFKESRNRTSQLESELADQSIYFNRKEAELVSGMQNLKTALQKEKESVEVLSENLKQVTSLLNNERKQTLEMQEVIVTALEKTLHLEEELIFERSLLAAKDNEIIANRQTIKEEQTRTEEAFTALKESQADMVTKQALVQNLENLIREEKQKISFLETQLGNQFAHMALKEKEYEASIKDLKDGLQNQKMRTLDLYAYLEDTVKKYFAESVIVTDLEKQLHEKDQKVQMYESELASLRTLFDEKETELMTIIEDLKYSVQAEESKATDFSDALQEAVALHFAEEQKASELEFRLFNAQELADKLQQQIAQKDKEIEVRRDFAPPEQVKQLETLLESALSQAKNYETELHEKRAQIAAKEAEWQNNQQQLSDVLQQERSKTLDLQETLKAAQDKVSVLESELETQRFLLSQREQEIKNFQLGASEVLQKEKEQIQVLENSLSDALENSHTLALELNEQQAALLEKEQELLQKEQLAIEALAIESARVQELEQELSLVLGKATLLEHELSVQLTTNAQKEYEMQMTINKNREYVQELEGKLTGFSQQTQALENDLVEQRRLVKEIEAQEQNSLAQLTSRQARIGELEEALNAAEKKNQAIVEALEEQKTHISRLEQEIEAWSGDDGHLAQMENELLSLKKHAVALELELEDKRQNEAALKTKAHEIEFALQQAKERQEGLEEQLSVAVESAKIFENELMVQGEQIKLKEKDLFSYQERLKTAFAAEQKSLEGQVAKLEADLSRYRTIEQEEAVVLASLMENYSQLEREKLLFLSELKTLKEQERETLSQLLTESSRADELAAALSSSQTHAAEMEKQWNEQRALISFQENSLAQEKKSAQQLEAVANELKMRNAALEAELKELESQYAYQEQTLHKQIAETAYTLEQEKHTVLQSEAALAQLQEQKSALELELMERQIAATAHAVEQQAANQYAQALESRLASLQTLTATLEKDLANLQSKTEATAKTHDEGRTYTQELETLYANLKANASALEGELAEHKMQVISQALELDGMEELRALVASLKKYSDNLEKELTNQTALAASKEQEVQQMIQKNNAFKQQQQAQYQELEERYSIAVSKVILFESTLEEQRSLLLEEEAKLRTALQEKANSLAQEQQKAEELSRTLAEAMATSKFMEGELLEQRHFTEAQEKQLQMRLAELETVLQTERAGREQLETRLSEALANISSLEHRLTEKEKELASRQSERQELEQALSRLSALQEAHNAEGLLEIETALQTERAGKVQTETRLMEALVSIASLENSLSEKENELATRQSLEMRERQELEQTLSRLSVLQEELNTAHNALKDKGQNENLIQHLKAELSQEKAFEQSLYDTLKETLSKYDEEQVHAQEVENRLSEAVAQSTETLKQLEQQKAYLNAKETEMQFMIDQYALANGDLMNHIDELRMNLDNEQNIRAEIASELQEALSSMAAEQEYRQQLEKKLMELSSKDALTSAE